MIIPTIVSVKVGCEEDGYVVGIAMGDYVRAELTLIGWLPEFENLGIGWQLLVNIDNRL